MKGNPRMKAMWQGKAALIYTGVQTDRKLYRGIKTEGDSVFNAALSLCKGTM
jgi:hypothetical protein